MLHTKDITNVRELKNSFSHSDQNADLFFDLMAPFKTGNWKNPMVGLKIKGYSFQSIISVLIVLPFTGQKTVRGFIHSWFSCVIEAQKDVFYRLMNSSTICWRVLLYRFVTDFNRIVAAASQHGNEVKCLILDDSLLPKTGKKIEFMGRVWDHVRQTSVLGFKLLVLGYFDGTSFIPVDFSFHREKGRNKQKPYGMPKRSLNKQYKKQRDKKSAAAKRVGELDKSKIKCGIKMIKRAISKGLKVDYVLCDSWFTSLELIEAISSIKKQTVHLIGMYKTAKTKFECKGMELTTKQIREQNRKNIKRCRRLGLQYIQTSVWVNGRQLKMFFSRKGNNGKWRVFLCSDRTLSFIKMMQLYQIRWGIEVFFKECKQLLGLGKCQSNDFDAQIGHTTIVMISFILMTLRHRFDQYETKGGVFVHTQQEMLSLRLSERLWGLLVEVLKIITELFEEVDEQELVSRIINNQEAWAKLRSIIQGRDVCQQAA
ncbi:MAG: transposase [Lutibacter sp.]|jgi:hypothetical protein|nr:transposase [Lutibacter sp.]